jgi:hypothetical protein
MWYRTFRALALLLGASATASLAETGLAEQEATAALFDCLRGASASAWGDKIPPTALEIFLDDKCVGLKALATAEYEKSYKDATKPEDAKTFANAHTDFATRHFVTLYKEFWEKSHPAANSRAKKPSAR